MRLGRIRRRADIDALRRSRRSARSGALRVVMQGPPGPTDATEVAVAFAVPRRVGTAVHRNRIRRQLREVFRLGALEGTIDPGRYLVVVSPGVGRPPQVVLAGHVRAALDRLRSVADAGVDRESGVDRGTEAAR